MLGCLRSSFAAVVKVNVVILITPEGSCNNCTRGVGRRFDAEVQRHSMACFQLPKQLMQRVQYEAVSRTT